MIDPIPMLRVKKACPIAVITTPGVIFEKSGLNKKLKVLRNSPVTEE